MSIQSIQSKYPNAVWYDSNHGGSNNGTLENPYTSITTALNAQDRTDPTSAVAIVDGTHTFTSRIQPLDGTILVGESKGAILNFTTSTTNYGTVIGQTNLSFSFTLETLKVYYNPILATAINRSMIFGGNASGNFVKIFSCVIEMGPNILNSTGENRGVFGGRNGQVDWTIHDTTILAGASAETHSGVLFGGSSERPANSVDMQRCSVFVKEGTNSVSTRLSTSTFTPNTFIFKSNIVYGRNSESWQTLPTDSSKNCYFNTSYTSSTSGLGTDNIFTDPLFVDPDNSDLRLRPGSPCINDSEPSLQDLYPNAIWVSGEYTGGSSDGSYDNPYTTIWHASHHDNRTDMVIAVKKGVTELTNYSYTSTHLTVLVVGENGTTMGLGGNGYFSELKDVSNITYTFKNIDFLNNIPGGISRGILGGNDLGLNLIFENCTYKSLDNCVQGSVFRANNITARNCFFESFVVNVIHFDGYNYLFRHKGGNLIAENCTFYHKKNTGSTNSGKAEINQILTATSLTETATFTNCIFYAEGSMYTTTGLAGSNFTGKTFTNCCVYSPDNFLDDFTASQDSGTAVLSDPLFVDRANGDFRLRPGSPCIII